MPTERKAAPERRFVRVVLPWIIAACALGVYAATLNPWVSFRNLQEVVDASGFSWFPPELFAPLNFLVTLPIRLLPLKYIPVALNLFAAVCGALTLALLARSVALLPHDRTHEQRERERSLPWLLSIPAAWLPPLVAVIACGLELSFWECATSANVKTGPAWRGSCEMLDLLLFAYIIRCLLEYRIDKRDSWLFRAALVYGAAMADNWSLVVYYKPTYFPLFIAALIWLRGLSFFNVQFLVRMALCGLAGMSLYLLLPLIQTFQGSSPISFWSALKINLGSQWLLLSNLLTKYDLFSQDKPLWVMALYSLLPVLAIAIRWPSYFGDTSKIGVAIATLAAHLVHAILFVLCAWIALDPPFSPRNHAPAWPFLSLYYLSALSLGYFVGYFILVFGTPAPASRGSGPGPFTRLLNRVVTVAVCVICAGLPILLISKNLPQIRITNGDGFIHFASFLNKRIADKPAIVLSDDPARLAFLQTFANRTAEAKRLMFVDTRLYSSPDYHRFLRRKYGERWPTNPTKEARGSFDPVFLSTLLYGLSDSNHIYYLEPSFGYYFEYFYLEPHGLIYQLKIAPTNEMLTPPLSAEVIRENNEDWNEIRGRSLDFIGKNLASRAAFPTGFMPKLEKLLHIEPGDDPGLPLLGMLYTRPLTYWGVELQKTNDLEGAERCFRDAIAVCPFNVVASTNLICNSILKAGRHPEVHNPQIALDWRPILEELGPYRGFDEIMRANGPFDEPTFCYAEGFRCASAAPRLYRQAINQFHRSRDLSPTYLPTWFWLAYLYLETKLPDHALKVLDDLRADGSLLEKAKATGYENHLLFVEAWARLLKKEDDKAETVLNAALKIHPDDQQLLGLATKIYMDNGRFTNALPLIERQLQADSNNPSLLLTNGFACLQAGLYEQAIPPLTRVIESETNTPSEFYNMALNYRMVANLRAGKLQGAKRDAETLQKAFPTASQIYYTLGEIAYTNRLTNVALRNYELYLTNAPNNPEEIKKVWDRLKELKPGYP